MPAKILTANVIGIESFSRDPHVALTQSENGAIAVLADNTPVFYAVTPARLAMLLALEAQSKRPPSDITLDDSLYHSEPEAITPPLGKFAMYSGWRPDEDFVRMSALWGIALNEPPTDEELASFVSYWQAEGKVFHHIQWQQKFARSLQISRVNGAARGADINQIPHPNYAVPKGFRG